MFKTYPFEDKNVDLQSPQVTYRVVENTYTGECFFGVQVASARVSESSGKDTNDDTFFGRYMLKKRPYLGPTTTDHELALMMANQAHCRAGDLIYDPFVGTGSIALACQHFGAFVIGSDIDIRVLKGSGVGHKATNKIDGIEKIETFNIFTNFSHYRLPQPDFLAMDISTLSMQRPVLDAIVCDPPYGVRARSQKIGVRESRKDKHDKRQDRDTDQPYFSQKEHFDFVELHDYLMQVALRLLVPKGRLVFLFHTDEASEGLESSRFPKIEGLSLVRSSRDKLAKNRARHLLTYVKE